MFFRSIPILNRGLQQFLDFSETAMEKRLKVASTVFLKCDDCELIIRSCRELMTRETSSLGFGATFLPIHLKRWKLGGIWLLMPHYRCLLEGTVNLQNNCTR